jgi:hypothetical protein
VSHTRKQRRAAGKGGPRPDQRYEDLGLLAGFPAVYDSFTRTWIVRINEDQVRFTRQSIIATTELMRALFHDGTRRDEENRS